MNTKLIELAGKLFGPKVSAGVAGAITVAGQVESRLAMSDTDATAFSVITDALMSGNVSAAVPGLIAAATAYKMRQAQPVEKKVVEDEFVPGPGVDVTPPKKEVDIDEIIEDVHAHYPMDPRNDEDSFDDTVVITEDDVPADPEAIENLWDALGMLTNEVQDLRRGSDKRITELDRVINTNGVNAQMREHKEQVRTLTADLKKQIIEGNNRLLGEAKKIAEGAAAEFVGDGFNKVRERINNIKLSNKQRDARIESLQYDVEVLKKPGNAANYNKPNDADTVIQVPDAETTVSNPTKKVEVTHANKSQDGLENSLKTLSGEPNTRIHGRWFGDPEQPLGIRQNNLGNIRPTKEGKTPWKGEIASSTAYAAFKTPEHGVRAMMYLLRKSYFQKRGLKTVVDIIHRWSPYGDPGNSRASVDNYVIAVASALGKAPNQTLDLRHNDELLITMVRAMAKFENGKDVPYDDTVFLNALELLR